SATLFGSVRTDLFDWGFHLSWHSFRGRNAAAIPHGWCAVPDGGTGALRLVARHRHACVVVGQLASCGRRVRPAAGRGERRRELGRTEGLVRIDRADYRGNAPLVRAVRLAAARRNPSHPANGDR